LENTGVWPLSCSNTCNNNNKKRVQIKIKIKQKNKILKNKTKKKKNLCGSGETISALSDGDVEDELLDLDFPHGVG